MGSRPERTQHPPRRHRLTYLLFPPHLRISECQQSAGTRARLVPLTHMAHARSSSTGRLNSPPWDIPFPELPPVRLPIGPAMHRRHCYLPCSGQATAQPQPTQTVWNYALLVLGACEHRPSSTSHLCCSCKHFPSLLLTGQRECLKLRVGETIRWCSLDRSHLTRMKSRNHATSNDSRGG